MKRILLTTTSLILAAGFAHADVTFSGKGEIGAFQDASVAGAAAGAAASAASLAAAVETARFTATAASGATETTVAAATAAAAVLAANVTAAAAAATTADAAAQAATSMTVYSGYDLNIAVSGASDNGITYSMGFDVGAGSIADRNDDFAMDSQGAEVGTSALTLGYAGLTLVVGQDKNDDLYDDSQNGDVKLSGAFGGLNFAAVLDTDSGATSNSFSLSGAAADMTWSLVSTDSDDSGDAAAKVTVGYTVSDALSMSFKHDNKGAADSINTISATLAMGSLTLGLSADDNNDNDISVGYAAGPMSVAYATDEEDAWSFASEYDLGGGASAFASVDSSEFTALGMSFAF